MLAYAVPVTALMIALLLLFSVSRWWGYLSSILLLTVFTTYVGLIWAGAFPRVPCNCAGILVSMGWDTHFFLNLGFIGMTVWSMEKSATVSYRYTEGPYRGLTDDPGKKEVKSPLTSKWGAATLTANGCSRFQLDDQELKKGGGKIHRPTAQILQVKWAAKNATGTKRLALFYF